MTRRIDIVGGGIAGLALAGLLDPSTWDVTLYEARPGGARAGTILGMWPAAMRTLAALGLAGEAQRRGLATRGGRICDADGRTLLDVRRERAGGAMGLLVVRPDLMDMLESAVPSSVRRVSRAVDDPTSLDGDVVVGADGVHSPTRVAVWGPRSKARVTPVLAVRGLLPGRVEESLQEIWGPGWLFGIADAPGDRTNWYAAFHSGLGPRSVDVDAALSQTRRVYAAAPPAVQAVLDRATPETSLAQRFWVTPPMPRFVRGRYAVVGDAAHAMTPNLGRGACEALVDTHLLATELNARPDDTPGALRRYEMRRVLPAHLTKYGSTAMGVLAMADRGRGLRDGLLRALPTG